MIYVWICLIFWVNLKYRVISGILGYPKYPLIFKNESGGFQYRKNWVAGWHYSTEEFKLVMKYNKFFLKFELNSVSQKMFGKGHRAIFGCVRMET